MLLVAEKMDSAVETVVGACMCGWVMLWVVVVVSAYGLVLMWKRSL